VSLIVADASVVLKWLVPERREEPDTEQALAMFEEIRSGRSRLLEPPHWLAETSAVLARVSAANAEEKIAALHAMRVPVLETVAAYATACRLAMELQHHLFDTLYHAVALEADGATLITADERYYRKAEPRGRILRLADYDV
jgi:predicted nucleic acid-binding protein